MSENFERNLTDIQDIISKIKERKAQLEGKKSGLDSDKERCKKELKRLGIDNPEEAEKTLKKEMAEVLKKVKSFQAKAEEVIAEADGLLADSELDELE